MDINELNSIYNQVMADLALEKRVRLILKPEQVSGLVEHAKESLNEKSLDILKKCLCLILYSKAGNAKFDDIIFDSLEYALEKNETETAIYCLNCISFHFIERIKRDGISLTTEFINIINSTLETSEPEVQEWCLRIVEQLDMKSILFKDKILRNKPRRFLNFNTHKKNSYAIIEMLEKRWSVLGHVKR